MRLILLLATFASASSIAAQQLDSVIVRIVDVGPGLCTLTRVPPGQYMVYDAGHWVGRRCIEAARAFVSGGDIHLMIISHSDSDHLGDAEDILGEFRVHRFIHTGDERETASWRRMMDSLASEVRHSGASTRSLSTHPLLPGEQIPLGDAVVTLVAGWHDWHATALETSEDRNALSIVARLDYAGRSMLFPGDAIGRRRGDTEDACKDSEAFMVEHHRRGLVPLAADVLIAPHHGGDNASSACFIDAVDPEWVVFSAGHEHGHPRADVAARYMADGIPVSRLLRTDRGDDEQDEPGEWKAGSVTGCQDQRGDDDVLVILRSDGSVDVRHPNAVNGCADPR